MTAVEGKALMSDTNYHEYLIIGAGPGGLQLGYLLKKSGRDYCILERDREAGSFFKTFPRHRTLISINKIYTGYHDYETNLRWDWNSLLCDDHDLLFKNFSREYYPPARALVDYLNEFVKRNELNVQFDTPVSRISRDGETFRVVDGAGRVFTSRVLVVASGNTRPYQPDVPGIELAENYLNMTLDRDDFLGQRVLILGKGNSAFETADHLLGVTSLIHLLSPHSVKMAWKSHYVGHLRAINNSLLDTYLLKQQNAMLDGELVKLERRADGKIVAVVHYAHAADEVEELVYDRVLCCTGFRFDDSIFDDSCRPELTIMDRFPAQTAAWESTNVPNLYFAGTLMQMRDFKKKQSGFIHGFRYNIHLLHRIIEERYEGVPAPVTEIEGTPEAIVEKLVHRANVNSGLWQQTGFMCDMVVVREGQPALYYEDLTVDYVMEGELGQHNHYYLMTMEFGQEIIDSYPDPFAVPRVHKDDVDRSELSTGIHPILRRYCRGEKVAEHHVIEDLLSEFKEDVHVEPQLRFFRKELGMKDPSRGLTAETM
jgi:thioredoxin reductase